MLDISWAPPQSTHLVDNKLIYSGLGISIDRFGKHPVAIVVKPAQKDSYDDTADGHKLVTVWRNK